MAFARWDPIRDLLAIQQQLDAFAPGQAGWTPPVDLHETPTEYVLTAEVPGLSQDEVQVQMRDSRLTMAGARRERTASCERYHRIERGHGSFSRTFQLPHPVDDSLITAEMRDGVLTVVCPKIIENAARRIDVS
jgi:HSP20 family protein